MSGTPHVLSRRALNRAALARQLLLQRANLSPLAAVATIAGLQAQSPVAPYAGLWSRLSRFSPADLSELVERRAVVRATMMRATLHLVTADDYVAVRQALQPVLTRAFKAYYKEEARQLEVNRLIETAHPYVAEAPRTQAELREFLAPIFPAMDPGSLVFALRMHLPLVQAAPAGTWRSAGNPAFVAADAWLGRPLATSEEGRRALVLRYLAAFGPATRQDVEHWSGLSRLQGDLDALAPELCTYRDEQGRTLYDMPGAPLPGEDVPAPPRFLPEWDNLLLAHADRTRFLPGAHRSAVLRPPGRVLATILVDGDVAGLWRVERARRQATLVIEPFATLTPPVRAALEEEGERLVRFVADEASAHTVRFG